MLGVAVSLNRSRMGCIPTVQHGHEKEGVGEDALHRFGVP
jgi:hypothetical protein